MVSERYSRLTLPTMTSYILRNGLIATFTKANEPCAFRADILVEGSMIAAIGEQLSAPAGAEVIDCTNKWITPGMVDTHRYVMIFCHIKFPWGFFLVPCVPWSDNDTSSHVWQAILRGSQCEYVAFSSLKVYQLTTSHHKLVVDGISRQEYLVRP